MDREKNRGNRKSEGERDILIKKEERGRSKGGGQRERQVKQEKESEENKQKEEK